MQAELSNRYDADCRVCRKNVAAGEGIRMRNDMMNRWDVFHTGCKGQSPADPLAPATVKKEPSMEDLDAATNTVIKLMAAQFMELVPGLVSDEMAKLCRTFEIKVGKAPAIKVAQAHRSLPDILTAVVAGTSPFLVGPAGSGKTTLAEQIADALKLKFYMAARVTSEYKLVGFIDANGKTVRTQFREAFEHGGVFLFDEVDASDPDALTAFNAALANGLGDFPDGMVRRHKDFVAIAAGNTFGRGADRQYVGRNQLDAATLDRFQTFEIDYDEQLELTLAGNADWTKYVQRVRKAIEIEKVRHVVSPRASISGAKLLAAGMDAAKVAEACVWKGMDATTKTRLAPHMGGSLAYKGN